MDIVVLTHFPAENRVPMKGFQFIIDRLLRAAYPNLEDVGFREGTENAEGINAFQIKKGCNKATKDQLEASLKVLMGQTFEISYAGEALFNYTDAIVQMQDNLQKELIKRAAAVTTPAP
jgi:hypothetical protein